MAPPRSNAAYEGKPPSVWTLRSKASRQNMKISHSGKVEPELVVGHQTFACDVTPSGNHPRRPTANPPTLYVPTTARSTTSSASWNAGQLLPQLVSCLAHGSPSPATRKRQESSQRLTAASAKALSGDAAYLESLAAVNHLGFRRKPPKKY